MAHNLRAEAVHGGRLVAERLASSGVSTVFTLSGGHLFSVYDGCRRAGIQLVDTRHEQTAAFAAEGWAKATREPGVCALTAGPGVTNAISAIAQASANCSPVVVLGGRAPDLRWGQGSLQELDHVPIVAPLAKSARTAHSAAEIPGLVDEAIRTAATPPMGPTFVDLPLDHVFSEASPPSVEPAPAPVAQPAPPKEIERAAAILQNARRPVIMAGTGLYWARAEAALRGLCEGLDMAVCLNGMARGCIASDHPAVFSRARAAALSKADAVVLVGLAMDFRLGFGQAFAEDAQIVVADSAEPSRPHNRRCACELYGDLAHTLTELAACAGEGQHPDWLDHLREIEQTKRAEEQPQRDDDRAPCHPMRIYRELADVLDRDAVVIGDGGDFVSYAGRVMETFQPGCWMDPGPYGCLGSGPGYALAAKLASPGRQVCLAIGDGAFGFSGLEFDTLARHGADIVAVMGNNGIWGLEKHPMESLYGYSIACDLQPGLRYDELVEALGGHGELVTGPGELRGALERAFAADRPALVNVLTDADIAYPRRANLA